MQMMFDVVIFAAGFGACWFSRGAIVRRVAGGEALVRSLEAKVAALKARL